MIINAKITSFDRVAGTDATGQPVREAVAFAAECCVDQITRVQKWTISAVIGSATQVCYVKRDDFDRRSIAIPGPGDLLHIEQAGQSIVGEVVNLIDRVSGIESASHLEIFIIIR